MIATGDVKQCSSCRSKRPLSGFSKNRTTQDGLQNVCKPCKVVINKNWKHGMASGLFDEMLEEQGGKCKICLLASDDFVIDHNHRTGKIRGLLCRKCNSALGMCNDDADVLLRAAHYLQATEE